MKVLLFANNIGGLISFRKEVVEAIINDGYEITISAPHDDRMSELEEIGAKCVDTEIDRRSTNPVTDLKLLLHYRKLIKREKPSVVLTYTIKPNVYGGMACQLCGVPQISNITGLGTAIENGGLLQKFLVLMYKIGLRKAKKVFFQNETNRDFCVSHKMVPGRTKVIPGSGVNLSRFQYADYPQDGVTRFLYIGRLMVDKGTREMFDVAKRVKAERQDVEFHIVGRSEDDFEQELQELVKAGVIIHHGVQNDVRPFIANVSALLHPSYHEGMSNVILESSAIGRPIVTTFANGCKDAVDDGVTGLLTKVRDADDLLEKVKQFVDMPWEEKKAMGQAARKKVEREFDRNIVVKAYLDAIHEITAK